MLTCLETLASLLTLLEHLGTQDEFHQRAGEYALQTLQFAQRLCVKEWQKGLPVLILRSAIAVSFGRCARLDWNVNVQEKEFWRTKLNEVSFWSSLVSPT